MWLPTIDESSAKVVTDYHCAMQAKTLEMKIEVIFSFLHKICIVGLYHILTTCVFLGEITEIPIFYSKILAYFAL